MAILVMIERKTRPGVQQCQAQGLVFRSLLGLIQDRIRMCKIKGTILTSVWLLRTCLNCVSN